MTIVQFELESPRADSLNMRHAEETVKAPAKALPDTPARYTENKGTRAERKPILGIPGYQINAAGVPWKYNRRMSIDKGIGGLPVVCIFGEELLLDEIVARAFLGPPPINIRGMTVLHFDGDNWNCRVDNIRWLECPEWEDTAHQRMWERFMRPDHLPKRTFYF